MRKAAGLTLVEVLIAMVLVLLVCAASLAFVARGRSAHRAGASQSGLQETLDAAFSVLDMEVAMAGYLGLAPPSTNVSGATPVGSAEAPGLAVAGGCVASLAQDLAVPLTGADAAWQAGNGLALRCQPAPDGRVVPGSDTLIVRHANAQVTTRQAGRLQLETTLRRARLVADAGAQYDTAAHWHDLEAAVYYVSADSTGRRGRPSLRRKRLVGGTRPSFQDEELVSGIADLQVEFGIDGDDVNGIDRWVAPGLHGRHDVIRAVRLRLSAVTDVADVALPEPLRRQEALRVIALRNAEGSP